MDAEEEGALLLHPDLCLDGHALDILLLLLQGMAFIGSASSVGIVLVVLRFILVS